MPITHARQTASKDGAEGVAPASCSELASGRTPQTILPGPSRPASCQNGRRATTAGVGTDAQNRYVGFVAETAPPPPACDPDVNCDGAANGFDIEVMEQAVNGDTSNFCQPYPDDNRDGALNGFDVEAVEQGVNGGPCP